MKLSFDEERWAQLEEHLKVARLCGENADGLSGHAKGVLQRTVATTGMEKDVSPQEAEHALLILRALRHSVGDAAEGYASAVARLDELIGQLEPPAQSPGRPRARTTRA